MSEAKTYVRVTDGIVRETVQPFFNERGEYVPIQERFVPEYVDSLVEITGMDPAPTDWWLYSDGVFSPPPPPPGPTEEEQLAMQSAKLQGFTQLASSQKTALTNRVGTLNDAIELEMATPEEVAELPVRTTQLTAWKKYAVLLGRVTTQPGWYSVVEWPVQPPEGMDLTVSAVAGKSAETK